MHPSRAAAEECGIFLGRQRGLIRRKVYATLEDVVLTIAPPPRSGKTAWLAGAVLDAPGPALVTSTRGDVYDYTAEIRQAKHGPPLYVFNPEGLGRGIGSNFRWSPITGCHRPSMAMLRAGYLLAGSPSAKGVADRNFWDGNSFRVLRCYLYAAAVSGASMAQLAGWINGRSREPLKILENHPDTPDGWAVDLAQLIDTSADKTREGIFITLGLTFEFMADPALPGL